MKKVWQAPALETLDVKFTFDGEEERYGGPRPTQKPPSGPVPTKRPS
ncbi:paeninodin family lasso peptide [Paenibacillus sp. NEAU-GSW1]|nr:paeninodin family lasso peptide [Paenibacillus sp. NEAU-GSW1]MUT68062.1 paeninodin family lasso peptide [Paenibacillus sp. NEAU-GSW1]